MELNEMSEDDISDNQNSQFSSPNSSLALHPHSPNNGGGQNELFYDRAQRVQKNPNYKRPFHSLNVPEPLDLIAKTVHLVDEQIKTGAPICFLNLERFQIGRKLELEKLAKINGVAS